jgi:hypothetical protein
MSEIYIPSSKAAELSAALWALARPPQVVAPSDTTTEMFRQVRDLQGEQWIVVQPDFEIIVHPLAELNGIAAILQPWIDGGHLSADTNAALTALVKSKRGQALTIYDAFPPLFKSMAKTREQMEAEGLLTPPPTP